VISAPVIAAAIALDALVGDPPGWPHPVRAIGALIATCDAFAEARDVRDRPIAGRLAGVATATVVVVAAYASTAIAFRAGRRTRPLLHAAVAASALAWRSLFDEVRAVERELRRGNLPAARTQLARIVGRDTHELDESEVARAVIETTAESLCDGVVAPLLYLALGGPPLALAYKAVNTLDSMIGHIEPPYRYFGWFSARSDDLANYIPARMSALGIVIAASLVNRNGRESLRVCLRDAARHRSPNAGWSEAAMAGALRVRLGGPTAYGGIAHDAAVLGAEYPAPRPADIPRAIGLMTCASVLLGICAITSTAVVHRAAR
jgi:adenosylcobinamide-phosphate synthase